VPLFMILDSESWMNIRRFRALHAAGATYAEIARECEVDWRTVKKYLAEDTASAPPTAPPRAEHGFTGSYQRVKMFLAEARPRIAAELAAEDENPLTGLHRRFEVVPGAQAQVDWGDEGDLLGGHVLGLPPSGVRALRRGPGKHRL
jgi:transposase